MSELREDPVSGDWIILAPGRAKRPEELLKPRQRRASSPRAKCPFEDLQRSGNWPPIALYPSSSSAAKRGGWKIAVIPNKYPALTHEAGCAVDLVRGPYHAKTGVGSHEIVITRDHRKNFAELDPRAAEELLTVIQARHRALAGDRCGTYISTFFNWGREAGASISHPHYQILALPIVPPHASRSLAGALRYFKKHHRCVRCDVIAAERKRKERVVAENRHAIAIAPYAAKRPFEVSIFPKVHEPYFAKASPAVIRDIAALLQSVMRRIKDRLHDPDLNFFIHDAPVDGRPHPYHHWHIEVVPVNVISPPGGFEVSTIININAVDPAAAASILRGGKTK